MGNNEKATNHVTASYSGGRDNILRLDSCTVSSGNSHVHDTGSFLPPTAPSPPRPYSIQNLRRKSYEGSHYIDNINAFLIYLIVYWSPAHRPIFGVVFVFLCPATYHATFHSFHILIHLCVHGQMEGPNDYLYGQASCEWSSRGSGPLQIIIQRIWPLANDHPEDLASCKWSYRGSGLLQMIIRKIWPLKNDHPEDLASCKWSSAGTGHLQIIIRRIGPLANDHLKDLAICKWSSGGYGLLQIINRHTRHLNHLCQDPDSISQTLLGQFVLVTSCGITSNVGPTISLFNCLSLSFFLRSLKHFGSSRLGVLD